MGLGNSESDAFVDDGDVGDEFRGGEDEKLFGSVSCSICLEVVTDCGDRSWAKLQCGHQFHLDCIGSAFNVKGAMQCPNCRKIEKGQWLYANGGRSLPEFSMDDWAHDEDLYDYSEMSFGVHWCPFSGLGRIPLPFDEGEFSSNAYHDLLQQHAVFAEHVAAVSTAAHPCPYIAYFGPIPPSSSNSTGNVSDASNFNNHWNGSPVTGEIPSSYAFPNMDIHYPSWDHHSPPLSITAGRVAGANQSSIQPVGQRSGRTSSDIPRTGPFAHPFVVGHSSNARAGSSVASSVMPPYQGSNARTRDRVQALEAYSQAIRAPVVSGTRRINSHRGLSQVSAVASSSGQPGLYFIPSSSSGRNFQEPESIPPTRFRTWERDQLPSFSINQVEREGGWSGYHQGAAGGSESGVRSGSYRQRHATERVPSQNR